MIGSGMASRRKVASERKVAPRVAPNEGEMRGKLGDIGQLQPVSSCPTLAFVGDVLERGITRQL